MSSVVTVLANNMIHNWQETEGVQCSTPQRWSPKRQTHTRSALLKCEVTGEASSHDGLREKMRTRRTSAEAKKKSRREWWSVTVGTLEANLREKDPGKHQLSLDWTRRNWKYLHFKVIMLFGTYVAWLKESVVPVVNLIRLPKTFSSSLNDLCQDFKKRKRAQRFIAQSKLNGAETEFNCMFCQKKKSILTHTYNNC